MKRKYESIETLDSEKQTKREEPVTLNIGGISVQMLVSTFRNLPDSMLAKMFNSDLLIPQEVYFFDRTYCYVEPILDYYRTGILEYPSTLSNSKMKAELAYWGISSPLSHPPVYDRLEKSFNKYMTLILTYMPDTECLTFCFGKPFDSAFLETINSVIKNCDLVKRIPEFYIALYSVVSKREDSEDPENLVSISTKDKEEMLQVLREMYEDMVTMNKHILNLKEKFERTLRIYGLKGQFLEMKEEKIGKCLYLSTEIFEKGRESGFPSDLMCDLCLKKTFGIKRGEIELYCNSCDLKLKEGKTEILIVTHDLP